MSDAAQNPQSVPTPEVVPGTVPIVSPVAEPQTSSPAIPPVAQIPMTPAGGSVAEVLLAKGAISQQQYDDLSLERINTNKSFETLIEEKKLVDDEVLAQAKSKAYSVPYVKLSEVGIAPQALAEIPQSVAQRFHLIPLEVNAEETAV